MLRTSLKYLSLVMVIAALVVASAPSASAFGHHGCCGWGGCGWGGCGWYGYGCGFPYDPCCGGCGCLNVGVVVCAAPYCDPCCGWGGCGWGGCGWGRHCGWSTGCCGSYASVGCCGSYGVSVASPSCGCGGVIQGTVVPSPIQSAPVMTPSPVTPAAPPAPAPMQSVPAGPKATSIERSDAGMVSIWVPDGAKVFVNGYETKSTGNLRQYISYGLKPGFTYNYEVRAVITRDGQEVEEIHTAKLTAGQRTAVAFSFSPKAGASLASAW